MRLSSTKNAIQYSLTRDVILVQLTKIQTGIKKVVRIIKKSDIPSIPKIKFNAENETSF